jgi:hypothetical protein
MFGQHPGQIFGRLHARHILCTHSRIPSEYADGTEVKGYRVPASLLVGDNTPVLLSRALTRTMVSKKMRQVTSRDQLLASRAALEMPPPFAARMAVTIERFLTSRLELDKTVWADVLGRRLYDERRTYHEIASTVGGVRVNARLHVRRHWPARDEPLADRPDRRGVGCCCVPASRACRSSPVSTTVDPWVFLITVTRTWPALPLGVGCWPGVGADTP